MGRKNIVYNYKPIVAGDMSDGSITGDKSTVAQYDTVTYKFKWSGGQATNGDIGVEYSDDEVNWDDLEFGTTITLDGASGSHRLIINEVGFKFTRPKYTRTNGSATGALEVSEFATNKGA